MTSLSDLELQATLISETWMQPIPAVTLRRGHNSIYYRSRATICIGQRQPDREAALCHELAHHLTAPGHYHDATYTITLKTVLEYWYGPSWRTRYTKAEYQRVAQALGLLHLYRQRGGSGT